MRDRVGSAPLTVIRGAAGFGKTTLLRQWRQVAVGSHAVLVSAQAPRNGHIEDFWLTVIDGLADSGVPLPAFAERRSPSALAERMLSTSPRPVVMSVDNFDASGGGIGREIEDQLLSLLPESEVRVVVCLRDTRYFDTRGHGRIDVREAVLIEGSELAFTLEETSQLWSAAGLRPARAKVEELHARTAGWPQLTATVIAGLVDSTRSAELDIEHTVSGLLHTSLTDERDGMAMRLAVATALPDTFTVELAEQLSSADGVRAEAERVESRLRNWVSTGLLLTNGPADFEPDAEPAPRDYRWAPAVREVLRGQEAHLDRERAAAIHSVLSHWYADHDQPAPALREAVQAQDWLQVIAIVESSFRALQFRHRNEELYQALLAAPLDIVSTSPLALLVRDDRLPVPVELFDAAVALPEDPAALRELGAGEQARQQLELGLVMLAMIRRRGTMQRAAERADQILAIAEAARSLRPAETAEVYPALQLQAGIVRLLNGDLAGAVTCLREAHARAGDYPRRYIESDAAGKVALAYAVSGDMPRAATWLRRHDQAALDQTWLEPRIRASASTARLLIAVDHLDLDAAAEASRALLDTETYREEFWAFVTYANAQYALHAGGAGQMLEHLDQARSKYRAWYGGGGVSPALLAEAEADLLTALGRGNQARAVLAGPFGQHPYLQVGQARLALLSGDADTAVKLAADAGWERQATTRHRQQMQLIQALAAHRLGRTERAATALRQAVDTARQSGAVAAFRTVPAEDLADLIASGAVADAAFFDGSALARSLGPVFPESLGLIHLTGRERQILDRLAAGMSIQQIANALHIAPNTAKGQRRTLYRKLTASSRADAVARARELGLLQAPSPSQASYP